MHRKEVACTVAIALLVGLSRVWIPLGATGRRLVEDRLCSSDGPQVGIGKVSFRLPLEVRIDTLRLRSSLGLQLRDVRIDLAVRPLLAGRIEPSAVHVDSLRAQLPSTDRLDVDRIRVCWLHMPILAGPRPLSDLDRMEVENIGVSDPSGNELADARDADLFRRWGRWKLDVASAHLPGRIRLDDMELEQSPETTSVFSVHGHLLDGRIDGRLSAGPAPRLDVELRKLDLSRLPLLSMDFPSESRMTGIVSGKLRLRRAAKADAFDFSGELAGDSIRMAGFPFQKSMLIRSFLPEFADNISFGRVSRLEGRLDPRGLDVLDARIEGHPLTVCAKGRVRPGGAHRLDLDCALDPAFARSRTGLVRDAMEPRSDGRFHLGAILEGRPNAQNLEISGHTMGHAVGSVLRSIF
jgi:hypothetical protein